MKNQRTFRPICNGIILALVFMAGLCPVACSSSPPDGLKILNEVADLVEAKFYDPNLRGVDWGEIRMRAAKKTIGVRKPDDLASIINDMLGELETSHTSYHPQTDPAYFDLLDIFSSGPLGASLDALFPGGIVQYCGIGVRTRWINARQFASEIPEASPAFEAGLKVGDELIAVESEPFHPIESFRGRVGRELSLTIRRRTGSEGILTLRVTPRMIRPGEMYLESLRRSVKMLQRGGRTLGYLRVRSYAGEQYHEAVEDAVLFGALSEAEGLILDIRGGWGGANPQYLNLFNHKVPDLSMIGRDGEIIRFAPTWHKPVVLLVDGGTRSGKEILAFGFQEYDIGPVVGSITAGAVVGGAPFLLSDGSLLFLATMDCVVDGTRLEGIGITPDVEVQNDLTYAAGADPQLETAITVLLEVIRETR